MTSYNKEFKNIVSKLKDKPTLLLHVCCGVCAVYPLYLLHQYFDITIYFTNSNIFPKEEYIKRLENLERYLKESRLENIKLIVADYDEGFQKKLSIYANEGEGLHRCAMCYTYRLFETYKYAHKHKYNYVTTVMSISNHKNARYINIIGKKLESVYPDVTFLVSDFKKDNGMNLNIEMNKEYNLYHQDYCGCVYSQRNK